MKPWYTKWSIIFPLLLGVIYVAMRYSGVDMDEFTDVIFDGVLFVMWVMGIIGAIASDKPVDPAQVLPRVRSATVERIVSAVQNAKRKVAP